MKRHWKLNDFVCEEKIMKWILVAFVVVAAGCTYKIEPAVSEKNLIVEVFVRTPDGNTLRLSSAPVKIVDEKALTDALVKVASQESLQEGIPPSLFDSFFADLTGVKGFEGIITDAEGQAVITGVKPRHFVVVRGTRRTATETDQYLWVAPATETRNDKLLLGSHNVGGARAIAVLASRPNLNQSLADRLQAEAEQALSTHQYEAAHRLATEAKSFLPPESQAKAEELLTRIFTTGGGELRSYEEAQGRLRCVALSPDNQQALVGNDLNLISLWDLGNGRPVRVFKGHKGPVNTLQFSADGKLALSGADDNEVKLWDVSTGQELRSLSGHVGTIYCVGFSPSGEFAYSGSADGTWRLWEVATGRKMMTYAVRGGSVQSVAISPNGKLAISGGAEGTVRVWEITSGRELTSFTPHSQPIRSVAFSPDGRSILTGSADSTVKLLDASGGRELRTFRGHRGQVSAVKFSNDGKFILSGGADGTLKVWDVATGDEVRTLVAHAGGVNSLALSRDSQYALSGGADNTLRLWQLPRTPAVVANNKP